MASQKLLLDYQLKAEKAKDFLGYSIKPQKKDAYLVSNFLMKVQYALKSEQGTKYIIELTSEKKSDVFYFTSEDMGSVSRFTALISPDFLFEGSINDLNAIKRLLFENINTANEITTLGYQKNLGIYAFSNGIINQQGAFIQVDDNGIVEAASDQTLYIPAFSKMFKDDPRYQNDRKFKFIPGKTDFVSWSMLQYKAYGFNGVFSLLFDISAIFSDVAFEETGFFPIFFKFGLPNTAKTSSAMFSLALFGHTMPASLEGTSTDKGFTRKLAQLSNALVVFEEFSNAISEKLVGVLKSIYNRVPTERGNKTMDVTTNSTPINSAVMMLSNELPTAKSALFTRVILLTYEKGQSHNPFNDSEKEAYEVMQRKAKEGLGNIVAELFKYRKIISETYHEMYLYVFRVFSELLKTLGITPDQRSIGNYSMVLTFYEILSRHITFTIERNDLYETAAQLLAKQRESIARSNETALFWDSVVSNIKSGYLSEGAHFVTKADQRLILIDYAESYRQYAKYCRSVNSNILDKESLLGLLKSSSCFYSPRIRELNSKEQRDTLKIKFENGRRLNAYAFFIEKASAELKDLLLSNVTSSIQDEEQNLFPISAQNTNL